MPKVIYKTEYENILKAITYTISKSCCKQFTKPEPDWNFCPFCGEKMDYETVVVQTGEVDNAKV